jgi:hypothetical protein
LNKRDHFHSEFTHFGFVGGFLGSLGLLLSLSEFLSGDLFLVEFMGELLLVDLGTINQHATNDDHTKSEDKEIIWGRGFSGVDTEFKLTPPMESHEQVE